MVLEALAGGQWWRIAGVYTDGFEVVESTDTIDGQVRLAWLPAGAVEKVRPVEVSC